MLRKLSLMVAGALVAATLTTAGSAAQADELVTHHEFQTNCSVTKRAPDDPIVFPNLPGASHDHSFVGNNTVNASTTLNSLVAAGPYNTYSASSKGLTPTPIGSPGREAIEAAINPEPGKWLYFVKCQKDGTSCFNETFPEHDKTVAKAIEEGVF